MDPAAGSARHNLQARKILQAVLRLAVHYKSGPPVFRVRPAFSSAAGKVRRSDLLF